MNPEPFILAAYAVAVGALSGLVLLSYRAMRRAEAAAEKLRGRR